VIQLLTDYAIRRQKLCKVLLTGAVSRMVCTTSTPPGITVVQLARQASLGRTMLRSATERKHTGPCRFPVASTTPQSSSPPTTTPLHPAGPLHTDGFQSIPKRVRRLADGCGDRRSTRAERDEHVRVTHEDNPFVWQVDGCGKVLKVHRDTL
jgi:hypothetical protein